MGFLDKHIPTLEGIDAERFLEMARQNEESANKIDFSEQFKAFEKIMKNSSLYNKKDFVDFVKEYPIEELSGMGNNQVQDKLEDMGMLDENDNKEKMVSLEDVCKFLDEHLYTGTSTGDYDYGQEYIYSDFDNVSDLIFALRKAMEG